MHRHTTDRWSFCISLPPQKRKNHCIAVIGDGAITGGMAYEAMNHAGFMDTNMIVILNDNQQARCFRCERGSYLVRAHLHEVPLPLVAAEACHSRHATRHDFERVAWGMK